MSRLESENCPELTTEVFDNVAGDLYQRIHRINVAGDDEGYLEATLEELYMPVVIGGEKMMVVNVWVDDYPMLLNPDTPHIIGFTLTPTDPNFPEQDSPVIQFLEGERGDVRVGEGKLYQVFPYDSYDRYYHTVGVGPTPNSVDFRVVVDNESVHFNLPYFLHNNPLALERRKLVSRDFRELDEILKSRLMSWRLDDEIPELRDRRLRFPMELRISGISMYLMPKVRAVNSISVGPDSTSYKFNYYLRMTQRAYKRLSRKYPQFKSVEVVERGKVVEVPYEVEAPCHSVTSYSTPYLRDLYFVLLNKQLGQ